MNITSKSNKLLRLNKLYHHINWFLSSRSLHHKTDEKSNPFGTLGRSVRFLFSIFYTVHTTFGRETRIKDLFISYITTGKFLFSRSLCLIGCA
jgi:hypothetical protein